MYSDVPIIVNGSFNSVVGNSNITLLAAPGAGFRYRVSFFSVALGRTSTTLLNVTLRGAAITQVMYETTLAPAVDLSDQIIFPEPGVTVDENDALQLLQNGSVAGDSVRWSVGYYRDSV